MDGLHWLPGEATERSGDRESTVYVIRAFIEQREKLAANVAILKRLAEIDKTLLEHDKALRDIY